MLDVVESLLHRHRETGVLLDTNLLLVCLMAAWDKDVTLKFKRTNGYSADDLALLEVVLEKFSRIIVTPAILAEFSNLAAQLPERHREEFFAFVAETIPQESFAEHAVAVRSSVGASSFQRFGFADATVEEIGRSGVLVLTEDFPLYHYLVGNNIDVVNFTQLRILVA